VKQTQARVDNCCCVSALEDGQLYYPIFFTNENAFEEFYCICIQLVNKTWKEMRATSIDFTKVTRLITFYLKFWSLSPAHR